MTRDQASFNPLPHAEGDRDKERYRLLGRGFNPLPHAEGDGLVEVYGGQQA